MHFCKKNFYKRISIKNFLKKYFYKKIFFYKKYSCRKYIRGRGGRTIGLNRRIDTNILSFRYFILNGKHRETQWLFPGKVTIGMAGEWLKSGGRMTED